jgi:hypothetical protein
MGTTISKLTKAQRWRSRAAWVFVIGGVGYSACVVGLVQYWMTGKVSIRSGHESLEGETAILQLVFLGSISSLFCTLGIFFKYLARRQTRHRDS